MVEPINVKNNFVIENVILKSCVVKREGWAYEFRMGIIKCCSIHQV